METRRFSVSFAGIVREFQAFLLVGVILLLVGLLMLETGVSRPESNAFIPGGVTILIGLGFGVGAYLKLSFMPEDVSLSPTELRWMTDDTQHALPWHDIVEIYRTDLRINGIQPSGPEADRFAPANRVPEGPIGCNA